MKKITTLLILVSLVAGLFLLPGCGKKEPDVIKIGAVLCLTGSGAPYGEDAERGIRLATDIINEKGGLNGKKIELIIEDDQTNPRVSASAVSKLINQDRVEVIIGAITSSSMLADAPIAENAKVVLISPGASNPNITSAGDFIFRNWISDALEGKAMADYVFNDDGFREVAILYLNNDYGLGLKQVFRERFEELGGNIVLTEFYNQDDTDFRTQLSKITKVNPEVIYLPGYYKEMALIVKQSAEMGIRIPFRSCVCFEEPALLDIAKKESEGVIYSSPYYNPNDTNVNTREFVTKFESAYKRKPGIFAGHGFDAMNIIVYCINNVDDYSAVSIRDCLYSIKDYPGVSGITTFDNNGDVIKLVAIKKIENGDFEFIKCINIQ